MKVAAIIQARMGSKRYPGKVLETISNHPVLYHVIERIRDSQSIDVIVVATTTDPEDKILLKRAKEFQVHSYSGPEHDLIKRFLSAAEIVGADVIVRIPCDNPLFEPSYIDDCLSLLQKEKADYCYVEDAVLGTGVDVFTKEALKKAHEEAKEPHYKEHIITYFKDNPDKFKIVTMHAHERFKLPTLRLTFDTKEDLKLIRVLYHKFYQEDTIIPLVKVITYLKQHPEIANLNVEIIQKAAEESELAAKAKAEADAIAAAERAAAREKEAAEKKAAKARADLEKQELTKIDKELDLFSLEKKRSDESEKRVKWEDIFPDNDENKAKDEESKETEIESGEVESSEAEDVKSEEGEEDGEGPDKELEE